MCPIDHRSVWWWDNTEKDNKLVLHLMMTNVDNTHMRHKASVSQIYWYNLKDIINVNWGFISCFKYTIIYRIMHELPWITIFWSRVRRFDSDFHSWRSHEWKSLPNHLASDKESLFTVTKVSFYFLYAFLCHEDTNPLRTIVERSFRNCCQGRPFLTEHCGVTTIDLWRHANAKYWYCDVIFVYCHCTRKLAQRRSSLLNNTREYRYLTTTA